MPTRTHVRGARHVAKPKPTLESTSHRLSTYKFNASDYIVLRSPVHREPATGKLSDKKFSESKPKAARAK